MYPKKFLFVFLAFLVPLLFRAIPELLMGSYIVGFDNMAHYVPTSMFWLNGNISLSGFIATAPLFYSIVIGMVWAGGPLLLVLKIVPSLLAGFLGVAVYGFSRLGLGWSPRKSVVTALIGTVYFVAIRISWDLLREQLALIFLFVVLTLLALSKSRSFSWKRYIAFSIAMLAVILSNQLVAVVMLGIVGFSVIYQVIRRKKHEALQLIVFSLPAVVLFLMVFFLSPVVSDYRLIFGFDIAGDGWLELFGYLSYPEMIASEVGFFFYCFLPLLPLVALSVRRFRNFEIQSWILFILLISLIPLASPSNLRWVMMLVYPLAFYVADALSRIKNVSWKRYKMTLLHFVIVYLVFAVGLLSLGLALQPPEQPFGYFDPTKWNSFVYQIPTSLLQNTVSITDCPDVPSAIGWFKQNAETGAILLTHRAFYGWALTVLNADQIIQYEYNDPVETAISASAAGHSQIYMVWWVEGQGWYGVQDVSPVFHEVYRSGRIAIYSYLP